MILIQENSEETYRKTKKGPSSAQYVELDKPIQAYSLLANILSSVILNTSIEIFFTLQPLISSPYLGIYVPTAIDPWTKLTGRSGNRVAYATWITSCCIIFTLALRPIRY